MDGEREESHLRVISEGIWLTSAGIPDRSDGSSVDQGLNQSDDDDDGVRGCDPSSCL